MNLFNKNVIKFVEIEPRRALVLVQREHHLTPFVVWDMNTETGATTCGSYCATFTGANKAFDVRLDTVNLQGVD